MDTDGNVDDDEDVVLPNSPLYEHLKETGFEDLCHEEDKIYTSQGNIGSSEGRSPFNFYWSKVQVYVMGLKDSVCHLGKDILESFFTPEVKAMQSRFSNETLQTVIDSGVLIEEDVAFLKSYSSDDTDGNVENVEGIRSGSNFWLMKRAATPLLLLLMPLLFSTCNVPECLHLVDLNIIFLGQLMRLIYFVSGFLIVLHCLKVLLFFYFNVKLKSAVEKLEHICTTSKVLASSFKKCIRIIQEAEMIARGFTLVSVSGLAQRLELSVDLPVLKVNRQHPEFRKSLFSWMKSVFIKHKEATLSIIDSLPLSKELDCYSHYIATLNLEDYGDILNLDMASSDGFTKLLEVTDSFSLSCLKSILQLAEVQISEYLKLVYLYVHFIFKGQSTESHLELTKMKWLNDVLSEILKYNDDMIPKVQETHKYYQSIEESTCSKDDTSLPDVDNSALNCLKVYIHSLSLHLKAALKRVTDLEEILYSEEMKLNGLDDPAVQDVLQDKIRNMMSEAKAELDSSKECLLDGCEKLNSLFPQKIEVDEPVIPAVVKLPEPSPAQPVPIIPNSDPVPEDEVFEAFITDAKITEENNQSSDWFEAEMKQQKENEASSRMMRELRVVLVAKAEEHKMREQVALNLKYGKESDTENQGKDGHPESLKSKDICNDLENDEIAVKEKSETTSISVETPDSNSCHVLHQCIDESEKTLSSTTPQDNILSNSQVSAAPGDLPVLIPENSVIPKLSGDSSMRNEEFKYNFYPAMGGKSFASSIAALAARRNKLCGLSSEETFIGDSEINSDSDASCD